MTRLFLISLMKVLGCVWICFDLIESETGIITASTLFLILLTMVFEDILAGLRQIRSEEKPKPNRKSGFQQRLEKALGEQRKARKNKGNLIENLEKLSKDDWDGIEIKDEDLKIS